MPGGRRPGRCPERPDPSGNSFVLFGIDTGMFGIETLTWLFAKAMLRDDWSWQERFAAG
jgi:hypothetical protein